MSDKMEILNNFNTMSQLQKIVGCELVEIITDEQIILIFQNDSKEYFNVILEKSSKIKVVREID